MTRHEALAPDSTCHPEVWALLPWAVNGTLEGHERRAVEDGLATCPSCRAELARCHEVAAAVLAAPARTWSPSPADVSRILARATAADDPEPPIPERMCRFLQNQIEEKVEISESTLDLADRDLSSLQSPGSALSLRKEVIQPQVLLQLPCYDFTPIASHSIGACLLAVSPATSRAANFRDVTGGVYKARERIHRSLLICDY